MTPNASPEKGTMEERLLNLLYGKMNSDVGRIIQEKDDTFISLESFIRSEVEAAREDLKRQIREEIIYFAEPYDDAKWLNQIDPKKLLEMPSLKALAEEK